MFNLEKNYFNALRAVSSALRNGAKNGLVYYSELKKELFIKGSDGQPHPRYNYNNMCEYCPDNQDLIQAALCGFVEMDGLSEDEQFSRAYYYINKVIDSNRKAWGHKSHNIYINHECLEELLEREIAEGGNSLAIADPLADGTYNLNKITKELLDGFGLSQRQKIIAGLLVDGWTEKQIANKLKTSVQAVNKNKLLIRDKMSAWKEQINK